jgi:hypothetical protein
MMSINETMELADALATEFLELARRRQMSKHELLMTIALVERLLQRVVVFDDVDQMRAAMEEADATLKAMTEVLEIH